MFKHCENKKENLMKKESYASSAKLSVASVACRICYDNDKGEELVAPCYCKGSVAFVHRSCLEAWCAESGTTNCELCHQLYRTDKAPKGNLFRAVWNWLKNGPRSPEQGVRVHIIACTVITPLAIILVTYIVCMYYSQKSASPTSPDDIERNSSVSLLTVIGIILIGYYLWVYSVTRIHAKWQRTCLIRYIPRNVPEDQIVLVPNLASQNRENQNTLRENLSTENQDGGIHTYPGAETSQFDTNIAGSFDTNTDFGNISFNNDNYNTNLMGKNYGNTDITGVKTELGEMRSNNDNFDTNIDSDNFTTTDTAITVGNTECGNSSSHNTKKEEGRIAIINFDNPSKIFEL